MRSPNNVRFRPKADILLLELAVVACLLELAVVAPKTLRPRNLIALGILFAQRLIFG